MSYMGAEGDWFFILKTNGARKQIKEAKIEQHTPRVITWN
jgi:hypothetical protein